VSVTVGDGLTDLGQYAFAYSPNLTSVYFEGNAPTNDSTVFVSDDNVTVYYLPGAIGWDSFYAEDRPAVLWNPLIETEEEALACITINLDSTLLALPKSPSRWKRVPIWQTLLGFRSCLFRSPMVCFISATLSGQTIEAVITVLVRHDFQGVGATIRFGNR